MSRGDTEYTKEYMDFCREFWECVQLPAVRFENVERKTLESAAAESDPNIVIFWKRYFDLVRSYRQGGRHPHPTPTPESGVC